MQNIDTQAGTEAATLLPKDLYVSRECVALEKERLWPQVWQVACREEEVPKIGDFLTFDVGDDSIIVVRAEDGQLRAYHNTCQHRGRRLTDGCGHTRLFTCPFHGWTYGLDGVNRFLPDRGDWGGSLRDEDVRLKSVAVGTWAGFVFVSMARKPAALSAYLDPAPSHLDAFEIERMRYRWYLTVEVDCNWKIALEAFNESYHVAKTHSQLNPFMDYHTVALAKGDHGMFQRGTASRGVRAKSEDGTPLDVRGSIVEYFRILSQDVRANITERDLGATQRILSEVSADTPVETIMARVLQFQKEAAIASGAGWPDITPEQIGRAGLDWHIFPNLIVLPYPDGVLAYRARPNGDDPGKCIFNIWSLQRYAPGTEPALERKYFKHWRDNPDMPPFLAQDFGNIPDVQRGVRSRGFVGARPNPVQEAAISNFHRALRKYLATPLASAS